MARAKRENIIQTGGLVGKKEQARMIEHQQAIEQEEERVQIERMREILTRAYNKCVEKMGEYLPSPEYSQEEHQEVARFVVENRQQLIDNGYDIKFFLNMFAEMVTKMKKQENATHETAFNAVLRASYRLIGQ